MAHEPRLVLRAMWAGFISSRYSAYRLARKDIRAMYTKSALGVAWDLFDPLVLGIVFYFLRRTDVLAIGEIPMPYGLFVIYGLLMYATFSESLLASVDLLRQSKGLLSQLKLAPEAMIMSIVYRMGFNSIFRIVVMVGFSIALGEFSIGGFFVFLGLYGALILSGMSVGLLLSPFHAIYNDVGRFCRIILTPFRYVSPVLWPIPNVGAFFWLNFFNPIGPFISDLRLLATTGAMQEMTGFAVRLGIYGLLFFVACYVFRVAVPIIVDRA